MNIRVHRTSLASGFSLIEILVAVVILATGLLALTALQGRLAQSSSEAKTRSRVASMLVSRVDELRAGQYDNADLDVPSAGTTTTSFTCAAGAPAWLCAAQTESGLGSLQVSQTVVRYLGTIGASGAFSPSSAIAAAVSTPEFKRIILTASWVDASNDSHTLAVTTDVSPLSLRSRLIPNPPGVADSGGNPVVRQDSPATDGVIPLTVGNAATAASNPRPEILEGNGQARDIVGTRFDVLTYAGNTGEAVIQRRVETSVIQCSCSYGKGGAANLGEIYATPQWPATWDGTKYRLVKTVVASDASTAAPGATKNAGPTANVDQSALCTECCRDHHDLEGSVDPDTRFDPQRRAPFTKYRRSSTGFVAANDGEGYVNACRLVRVDGFWRTASDMYARHFGLLPTRSKSEVDGAGVVLLKPATSGVPRADGVKTYETFVKDYLGGITGDSVPPTNADTRFASYPSIANEPISIALGAAPDMRYLHARGLYIDYLGADATKKIRDALTSFAGNKKACPEASSAAECVLLYLPLSTVNLTEIANWAPKVGAALVSGATTAIDVNNDRAETQIWDPIEPTRGSTRRDSGTVGQSAYAIAMIGKSNAGVAVAAEVDEYDVTDVSPGNILLNDSQQFTIGTASSGNEPRFYVVSTGLLSSAGLGLTSNVGSCSGAPKSCVGITDDGADQPVTLTAGTYNAPGKVSRENNPCGNGAVDRPTYYNYALSQNYRVCENDLGTIGCVSRTGVSSIVGGDVNNGRKDESSTLTITVRKDRYVFVTFVPTSPALTPAGFTCGTGTDPQPIWENLGYGW